MTDYPTAPICLIERISKKEHHALAITDATCIADGEEQFEQQKLVFEPIRRKR
jgi:hypothetical protein